MRTRDLLSFAIAWSAVVSTLTSRSVAAVPAGTAGEAAAIVCWLTGEATVRTAEATRAEPLALLDRLPSGAVVQTGPRSELTLVFFDGARAVVEAGSRAVIRTGDTTAVAGRVRRLEPVPAVARLPQIAESENPGRRPGAGRIRDTEPNGSQVELYPRAGAALLSDAPILRFTAAKGVEEYHIEVTDLAGEEVFAATTGALEVRLPVVALRPETLHYWRLSSPAGDGRRLHGDGLFVVLDEAASGARRQLAEQAAASRDPGLEMLLAEADRRLGLRREACLGLASAVRRHPDDGALERALQRFECGGWHLGAGP